MKKENLEKISNEDLKVFLEKFSIEFKREYSRKELESLFLEALEDYNEEKFNENSSSINFLEQRYSELDDLVLINNNNHFKTLELDFTFLFSMIIDRDWLYSYWSFSRRDEELFLKNPNNKLLIKLFLLKNSMWKLDQEVEISFKDRDWHFYISRKSGEYLVTLFLVNSKFLKEVQIAYSNEVRLDSIKMNEKDLSDFEKQVLLDLNYVGIEIKGE